MRTGGKRLKATLEKKTIRPYEIIDAYNEYVGDDGICVTLTTGVDYRNHVYVAVEDKNAIQPEKGISDRDRD